MANRLIFGVGVEETSPPYQPSHNGPVWMYREGESKLFASPDVVPKSEGWVDSPAAVKIKKTK